MHLKLALAALIACCALVGSSPSQTRVLAAQDFEVLTPAPGLKGWRVLHASEDTSPHEDGTIEQASIVDAWMNTKPVSDTFPVPRAILIICGLLIGLGAYRVATRD